MTIYDSMTSDADFLAMIGYKENGDDDAHRPKLTRNSLVGPNFYDREKKDADFPGAQLLRSSRTYARRKWDAG